MRKLLLASISILFLASLSTAQEQPQHPIDKALDACIDKNGSTAGMVECTDKAYAAWDKELNKNYGELMRALNPKQKEALRLAQLEWIKYRDLTSSRSTASMTLWKGRCISRCESRRTWK